MNILDTIVSAQNGAAVRQAGSQVGLDQQQTATALSALVPALAAGFQQNLQRGGGLDNIVAALGGGNQERYIEDPSALNDPAAVAEGNGVLQQVLGSKDVSRQVATQAAAQTGIGVDVMKRLLPLAATMMMGALARRSGGPGAASGQGGGGLTEMLSPFLDRNRDGSIVDDVSGMLGRFTNRPK